MPHRRNLSERHAFTLIELLVVITIVVVLASLLLPMMGRIQSKGAETKTFSNMRAMGVALLTFAGDNSYQLPGRVQAQPGEPTPDKWPAVLQPYVQDLTIYGAPLADVNGKSYKMANPPQPYPQVYLSNKTNYTCYIYNGMNDVIPYGAGGQPPRLNILAQPSQTILLGVPVPQANNFYMDFAEKNEAAVLNKAAFADGTPYVFCDGSVRILAVDPKADNKLPPVSSKTYTDWLWLFDKSQIATMQ